MPFVRSSKGTRTRFASAKVSATITEAYARLYGNASITRWRSQIQGHVAAITQFLERKLGVGDEREWPRRAIAAAIEAELARAGGDVHEAYLQLHPERAHDKDASNDVDPVWAIQRNAAAKVRETTVENPLAGLGETVRRLRERRKTDKPKDGNEPAAVRRSDWLAFWNVLSQEAHHSLGWDAFRQTVMNEEPSQRIQSPKQWWHTWQEVLDRAVLRDPRLFALWGAAESRRARARVLGQDWLAGSALADAEEPAGLVPREGEDAAAEQLYRTLAGEHFRELAAQGKLDARILKVFPLRQVLGLMEPRRDRLLDWRGWQHLSGTGCLWPLEGHTWKGHSGRAAPGARELPQWSFMRLAMVMAVDEAEPLLWLERFYRAVSTLAVIPSETMLREAGLPKARYVEDQAARVVDDFEGIQTSIHRAAIGTKWTGTVTLDWQAVRARGAAVGGRRRSQGVCGFLRSIDTGLAAQGREGNDRPVTVVLPLWHREALDFLDLPHTGARRIQTVLSVPDAFFAHLREGTPWTFFDPEAFPEVVKGGADGYAQALAVCDQRLKERPGAARTVAVRRVWSRLVRAAAKGAPFLVFEDAQTPFQPFPRSAPVVPGIDGVGALPSLPEQEGTFRPVVWPSAAVNLAPAIAADGSFRLEHLRDSTRVALRLLDNALSASHLENRPDDGEAAMLLRPVCLGAVGLYEAIEHASAKALHEDALVDAWVSGLAEAWATAVIQSDQELARERGPAEAWNRFSDGRPFHPLEAVERLTKQRHGAHPTALRPRQDWSQTGRTIAQAGGHRCSVRCVWAPYFGAASVAGVTPGGIGTLAPFEIMMDEEGRRRLIPSALLLHHVLAQPEAMGEWRQVLRHPDNPKQWPPALLTLVRPERAQWERRLQHAALIRPWIDQGVSVTLPARLPEDVLASLIQRAWWLGLNSIRFAQTFLEREGDSEAAPEQDDSEELPE